MKITLIITLLLFFQSNLNFKANDQLDYSFDYRLKYECRNSDKDSIQFVNYYINSEKNNFYADIREKSNSIQKLYFRDQEILTCHADIKGDIKNPGTLQFPDSLTRNFSNLHEYKAKNYEILNCEDTLVSGKNYVKVIFKFKDIKKAKKKKIGKEIYIIDTTKKMKPLLTNPTSLNIWRINKNMPNGLIVEKHIYNFKGEISLSEKLIEIAPVNFNLLIERKKNR
jgi:hypothetical protein